MGQTALLAAFDGALAEVARVLGLMSPATHGEKLPKRIARLRDELAAEREAVKSRGGFDPGWASALVRRTAEWLPDTHLDLLAALGAIIRASETKREGKESRT